MHRPRRFPGQVIAGVLLSAAWVTVVIARSGTADGRGIAMDALVEAAPAASTAARTDRAPGTAAQQPPTPPAGMRLPPTGTKQVGATYVGDDTCLTCHEEQKKGYADTMHGRTDHARAPAAKMGCETCHGPGSKHAEDETIPGLIRAFGKEPPREGNETCLSCHQRGTHALWEGSVHDSRNLSCATCHSVHKFKSEHAQLKTAREMDTCATCSDRSPISKSGLPMPLRECKGGLDLPQPARLAHVKQLRKCDSARRCAPPSTPTSSARSCWSTADPRRCTHARPARLVE